MCSALAMFTTTDKGTRAFKKKPLEGLDCFEVKSRLA
jgi:hypothetical protein